MEPSTGQRPGNRRESIAAHASLLATVVVLVLVGFATRAVCVQTQQVHAAREDAAVADIAEHVRDRLETLAGLTAAVTAFEAGSEEVTDIEFAVFLRTTARGRDLDTAFPGLATIIVLDPLPDGGVQVRHASGNSTDAAATSAVINDCPACLDALRGAVDLPGDVLASSWLRADSAVRLGGAMVLVEAIPPVTPSGEPVTTADPVGWTALVVDLDRLLDVTSPFGPVGGLGVAGDDGVVRRAPADDVTVHRRDIEVFGESWTLLVPEPAVISTWTERNLHWVVLGFGIVLAGAVGGLVHALARSRMRALAAVATSTTQLRAANAQLGSLNQQLASSNDDLATSNQELEEVNAQLAQVNEELESFTGIVAHDLKSPLTTIIGMTDLVRSGRVPDEQAGPLLTRVSDNAHRLAAMIDRLLDYASAGRTVGELQPVDLDAVVGEALERLETRVAARQAEVTVAGPLAHVHGDHTRLVEVVQNLVSNALVHVPEDRTPTIHIATAPGHNGNVELQVADNGRGIPPEERDAVLKAFHRGADTKADTGTGLGIPTVHRIVTAHGGSLVLDDAPDGGLLVRVRLPGAATGR